MAVFGIIFLSIGFFAMLVGGVMLLVAAFKEDILWGLGVMLVPFANIVFLVKFWSAAKKGFLIQSVGCGMLLAGMAAAIAGGLAPESIAGPRPATPPLSAVARPSPAPDQSPAAPFKRLADIVRSGEPTPEIPVGNPSPTGHFVGVEINEVKERLGPPQATVKLNAQTILYYGNLELISDDGLTVTDQVRKE